MCKQKKQQNIIYIYIYITNVVDAGVGTFEEDDTCIVLTGFGVAWSGIVDTLGNGIGVALVPTIVDGFGPSIVVGLGAGIGVGLGVTVGPVTVGIGANPANPSEQYFSFDSYLVVSTHKSPIQPKHDQTTEKNLSGTNYKHRFTIKSSKKPFIALAPIFVPSPMQMGFKFQQN